MTLLHWLTHHWIACALVYVAAVAAIASFFAVGSLADDWD